MTRRILKIGEINASQHQKISCFKMYRLTVGQADPPALPFGFLIGL
jgi:hypothetical protein